MTQYNLGMLGPGIFPDKPSRGNTESPEPRSAASTDAPNPSNDWLEEALLTLTPKVLLEKADSHQVIGLTREELSEISLYIQRLILDLRIKDAEKLASKWHIDCGDSTCGYKRASEDIAAHLADLRTQREALK